MERLTGKQQASVRQANARLNVWEGAVRSSKTWCSLVAWLLFIRRGPEGNLLMVGKTERTLKRNVIDPLIEWLGVDRVRYVQGAGEVWILGRRVYVAGANDERAQEKIRGLTLVGAYVDEISTVPESFWSMLLSRLSSSGARLFGTTNPDSPNHWLKKRYLDRACLWIRGDGTTLEMPDDGEVLDLARFSFRLDDNPHLDDAYVNALKREYTGLWYLRFIDGEWVAAEGAVYPNLQLDEGGPHVWKPPEQLVRRAVDWWLWIDYGTTNPFVALLACELPDGRLHVAGEWRWDSRARHGQSKTDGQYSQDLRRWLEVQSDRLGTERVLWPARTIVDPSAASFHQQLLTDGWPGVTAGDNAVVDGIRNVASLLQARRDGRALLTFDPSCQGTLGELSGYVWDPAAQDKGEDRPLKIDDHGPDALRYGVRTLQPVWRHWLLEVDPLRDAA